MYTYWKMLITYYYPWRSNPGSSVSQARNLPLDLLCRRPFESDPEVTNTLNGSVDYGFIIRLGLFFC